MHTTYRKSIATILFVSLFGVSYVPESRGDSCKTAAIVSAVVVGGFCALWLATYLFPGKKKVQSKFSTGPITFDNIKGMHGVIVQLKEMLEMLRSPEQYRDIGATAYTGVLLYGPPGCGKTMLARAMAGELGCTCIACSGSEFVEVYVGQGAARVRSVFRKARLAATQGPVLLFIDEIDAFGLRRTNEGLDLIDDGRDSGNSEYSQTINELLVQMDGVRDNKNILIVAATNNIRGVDSALLRPGRFDRKIRVPLPDLEGRKEILSYYLQRIVLEDDLAIEDIVEAYAAKTRGFNGADIENFVREAAVVAVRTKCTAVAKEHFETALDVVLQKFIITLKKRYRNFSGESVATKFSDVKGQDLAVQEVKEFVHFLKEPDALKEAGAKTPKGILLYGPPGCGKTLIAKAMAGEAGCHFIPCAGSEFVEIFAGKGAKHIRELFNSARNIARRNPVIICIDEIDALGNRMRSNNQAVNELLVQMDGLKEDENLLVIATTNFMESLDTALLRPGRFDRKILVPLPIKDDREDILKLYLAKANLSDDFSIEEAAKVLAQRTLGMSGAELANVVNEAIILACRESSNVVLKEHFEEAIEKILLGLARRTKSTIKSLKQRAYHEAGHTIMSRVYNIPVNKVTILPRGMSGGATWTDFKGDESELHTRNELLQQVAALLGGYVAEEIMLGDVTHGSSHDLQQSSQLLYNIVNKFGMIKPVEAITVDAMGSSGGKKEFDDITLALHKSIVKKVRHVITTYKDTVEELAQALMDKETLDAKAVDNIVGDARGAEVESPIYAF